MREVSRDGLLTARAFSTPDGWHVEYRWRDGGTLEHFEVETSRGKIWLTYPSPGELGTSWPDLDAPMFERLLHGEIFTSGFPERPYALDDLTLADSSNVRGGLFFEKRLESLCRNPDLGSVNRMSVDVPEASCFELLERVILSCDLHELSFVGEEDGARSFKDWFRLRNGTSLFEAGSADPNGVQEERSTRQPSRASEERSPGSRHGCRARASGPRASSLR